MSKFLNLENVDPIWRKIDELYVRKTDLEGNVKDSLIFDLKEQFEQPGQPGDIPIINLSDHEDAYITQIIYLAFEDFIKDSSVRKYIIDTNSPNSNTYTIICEIINDNSMKQYDGINVVEQTNKLLILFNDSIYLLWAIHLDEKATGGANGTYRIIQQVYIDSITDEFINKLGID